MTETATPDPRHGLAAYPLRIEVPLRCSDGGVGGHVTNPVLADFYDDARAALHEAIFGKGAFAQPRSRSLVLAELTVTFVAEVTFPGTLTVGAGVIAIGRSSLREQLGLFVAGRCVGLSHSVMVHTVDRRPVPIADEYRARAAGWMFG